jgi:hypothetical protein
MAERRGRIRFGDEEEAAQTELLASTMIEQTATQHMLVGETVTRVSYVNKHWMGDLEAAHVSDLVIEFGNGARIRASQAVADYADAPGEFREALRAENARQRATAPRGGGIRVAGEAIGAHPGPKLDPAGDPIACAPDDVDESAGMRELTEPSITIACAMEKHDQCGGVIVTAPTSHTTDKPCQCPCHSKRVQTYGA